MTLSLPSIAPHEFQMLVESPELFVGNYLARYRPQIEFTKIKALGADAFFGEYILYFELLHTDVWAGKPVSFRTGEVKIRFNSDGSVKRASWSTEFLSAVDGVLPVRPLWLPSQFWDLIPMHIKMEDPDYQPDPFGGAADFAPVKRVVLPALGIKRSFDLSDYDIDMPNLLGGEVWDVIKLIPHMRGYVRAKDVQATGVWHIGEGFHLTHVTVRSETGMKSRPRPTTSGTLTFQYSEQGHCLRITWEDDRDEDEMTLDVDGALLPAEYHQFIPGWAFRD